MYCSLYAQLHPCFSFKGYIETMRNVADKPPPAKIYNSA